MKSNMTITPWNLSPNFRCAISLVDKSTPDSGVPSIARRRVAAHASAHAVIGALGGIRIKRVTLEEHQGGDWMGLVDWDPRPARVGDASLLMEHQATTHLLDAYVAGRGGEMLQAFGWPGETFTLDYAAPDTEMAVALALLISPENPAPVLLGALRRMGRILPQPEVWTVIDQVAKCLVMERGLSGGDIASCIKDG